MFLAFCMVNFLCFRGNRVNIEGVSTDKATRKSVHKILVELALFIFDAYYIKAFVKFDDFFPNSERKKKPTHVPIVKKIHFLECAQYAFLDHSKALVFSDIIKVEILFKYSRAHAICTYSSHTKKTIQSCLKSQR